MVRDILCRTPKPPRIAKLAPQLVSRRPLPRPASDQVTLNQYSRHRRSSLHPLAPAPKRPCPTPQYGSLLQRRASQSTPPTGEGAIWVIAPCASPPPTKGKGKGQCPLVGALWPGTEGELLRLGGQQ